MDEPISGKTFTLKIPGEIPEDEAAFLRKVLYRPYFSTSMLAPGLAPKSERFLKIMARRLPINLALTDQSGGISAVCRSLILHFFHLSLDSKAPSGWRGIISESKGDTNGINRWNTAPVESFEKQTLKFRDELVNLKFIAPRYSEISPRGVMIFYGNFKEYIASVRSAEKDLNNVIRDSGKTVRSIIRETYRNIVFDLVLNDLVPCKVKRPAEKPKNGERKKKGDLDPIKVLEQQLWTRLTRKSVGFRLTSRELSILASKKKRPRGRKNSIHSI